MNGAKWRWGPVMCLGSALLGMSFVAGAAAPKAGKATTTTQTTSPAAPVRGSILEMTTLKQYSRAEIAAQIDPSQQKLVGAPLCDVKLVALRYTTIGVQGEPAIASAMLLVPEGESCTKAMPLLGWARPTEMRRDSAQADELKSSDYSPVLNFFASQGYVVAATDYLGLGHSDYPYHPYLHAASEASAIIDALRAGRAASEQLHAPLSGKVMLAGYSQGGHAAMAAQREIEKDLLKEFNLVATAPMSGPYALEQTFIDSWSGSSEQGPNALAPYLLSYAAVSMQRVYGNLYTKPQELFQEPYASQLESQFPGALGLGDLAHKSPLPIDGLRQPVFMQAFIDDPKEPLRRDLRRNDVLGWTPVTPLRLCGAGRDAVVEFANAETARNVFSKQGVDVQVVNVDKDIPAQADGVSVHTSWASLLCVAAMRDTFLNQAR